MKIRKRIARPLFLVLFRAGWWPLPLCADLLWSHALEAYRQADMPGLTDWHQGYEVGRLSGLCEALAALGYRGARTTDHVLSLVRLRAMAVRQGGTPGA